MTGLVALARRNVRRAWRHQVMVVILIALPVGLGVFSAIAEASANPGGAEVFRAEYGSSEFGLQVRPDDLAATVDELRAAGAELLVYRRKMVRPGYNEVSDVDLQAPMAEGLVIDIEGRGPQRLGEVALSTAAAEAIGVGIGDRLPEVFGGQTTVVGIVHPVVGYQSTIYLAPGSLADDDSSGRSPSASAGGSAGGPESAGSVPLDEIVQPVSIGIRGLTGHEIEALVGPFGGAGQLWLVSPSNYDGGVRTAGAGVGAFVSAVLLVEAALLAAATFAIRSRRRVVEFGRLSAIGASPEQIKSLVLIEAVVVAVLGAMVGIVVAVVWAVIAPGHAGALLTFVYEQPATMNSVRLKPLGWVWPPVFAVVAALAAALVPARTASRLSTTEALASGGGHDEPPSTNLWSSLILAIVGFVLIGVVASSESGVFNGSFGAVVAFSGVVSLVLAVAGGASLALVWLDCAVADRLPISIRLALRDSARHRLRSVMALSASGLIIGVTVTAMTLAADNDGFVTYGEGASVARMDASSPDWIDVSDPAAPSPDGADLAERLGFDPSIVLVTVGDGPDERSWVEVRFESTGSSNWGEILVLDDDGVAALDLPPAVMAELAEPGSLVGLQITQSGQTGGIGGPFAPSASETTVSSEGRVSLFQEGDQLERRGAAVRPEPVSLANLRYVAVEVDAEGTAGQVVRLGLGLFMSAETAESSSLPTLEVGSLIVGDDVFIDTEVETLGLAGASLPRRFSPGGPDASPVSARAQLIALAVVMTVVVLIYRILAGLIAVDTDETVSTMLALGASSRMRQAHLAGHALVHLVLAVVMTVPVALIVAGIVDQSQVFFNPFVVPWTLLAGLLALPLIGAVFVALSTTSGVPTVSRRLT